MASPIEQGVTRREFLVRSATLAGGAFLGVGVPPGLRSGDAQAAMAATPAYTPSIWFTITPRAPPPSTSSRPRWVSTSGPRSRR